MLPLTELGHGRQGQKSNWGSEMGKQPRVGMEDEKVYHINAKCYPTYQEEPQLRNDPIPHREAEPTILTVELNQQSTRPCS